ncbi:MAG: hypothetical protein WKG00_40275 [Polyangiaceae bacterium]
MSSTAWFTGTQARATSRMAGSSSTTSTRSIRGTLPSQPAVLPVPRPMTKARRMSGWKSAPMRPLGTWVPASERASPSLLPLTMKAVPLRLDLATPLSAPSRSHLV